MIITTTVKVSEESTAREMCQRALLNMANAYGENDANSYKYEINMMAPSYQISITAHFSQIGEAVSFLYEGKMPTHEEAVRVLTARQVCKNGMI